MIKLKENKTKYVILGLLNHEDCSGYDIKNRVDVALSQFWSAGFGQIYPTLKKLEEDGLIYHCDSSYAYGPERKIYRITEEGKEELERWLKEPVEKEEVRYEILLKLFFGGAGSREAAIDHIQSFQQRNEALLTNLTAMQQELQHIIALSEDHKYYYLTALFGSKIYHAYIDWADEAMRILEAGEGIKEKPDEEQPKEEKPDRE